MQATNDIFLGYGQMDNETYFIRHLFDMKGSANLEEIPAPYLERYAGLGGAVLARAHARTGDPAKIAGYIGKSDSFDQALTKFDFYMRIRIIPITTLSSRRSAMAGSKRG